MKLTNAQKTERKETEMEATGGNQKINAEHLTSN